MALKLQRNDTVEVITGSDKGKRGRVLRVLADTDRVLVEHRLHGANASGWFVRPERLHAARRALREVLARVREDGYAAVDQELEEGLRSLAVPIHDASGAVVAALNVSVHASRSTMAAAILIACSILPLAKPG